MICDDLKKRFHSEVMNANIDPVLPANLSDEILDFLLSQFDAMSDPDDETSPAELLSAVLKILFFKCNYKELEITHSQLLSYVDMYGRELSAEKVNRTADSRLSSPTIETILTNRAFSVVSQDRK